MYSKTAETGILMVAVEEKKARIHFSLENGKQADCVLSTVGLYNLDTGEFIGKGELSSAAREAVEEFEDILAFVNGKLATNELPEAQFKNKILADLRTTYTTVAAR